MGQNEVLNFLKSVKKMYATSEEISKNIDVSVQSVKKSLKKLYEQNEVDFVNYGKHAQRLWTVKKIREE